MREIKFRAWDKTDKNMHYAAEVGSINGYKFYELIESEHYEIMQFTGLKDRLGKEIYEGDIIEFWNNKTLIQTGEIVYAGCKFSIACGNDLKDIEFYQHIGKIELVGTRYENPELLEETKK